MAIRSSWRGSVGLVAALILAPATPIWAITPQYEVTERGVSLKRASRDCPVIYDNDFWTDVPDAAYIWVKASRGECNLRGNIITRCTFGWEKKYAHELKQQTDEASRLLRLAKSSGLQNIPEPVIGATVAIQKPASGRLEDTKFERSAGSELIVAEARKAKVERPLLIFCGGSCTTVASAYLSDPSIADRVIVFQIDGGGYNGTDGWAWQVSMRHLPFANWARGYFWDKVSVWKPDRFNQLPKNPLCDFLREYADSGLGKANQWGDRAWVFQLYDQRCLTKAENYDGSAITIPKDGTNAKAMEEEFFRTMSDAASYGRPK